MPHTIYLTLDNNNNLMNKKLSTLLFLILFGIVGINAQDKQVTEGKDYSYLYKNLPIPLERPQLPVIPERYVKLTDYGAVSDGITLCTEAFKKAIDDLSSTGGGHLIIEDGIWLTGPVMLKSNIDINLRRNAIVKMTPDKSKHKNTTNKTSKLVIPAFYAKNAHDISITGLGAIDGSGAYWRPVKRSKVSATEWKQYTQMGGIISADGNIWYPYNLKNAPSLTNSPEEEANARADLIRVEHCERVLFQDITVQNSPRFHVHPCYCKDVSVLGVIVRCPWNAQNGDAIDLSNCNRCLVTECTIDAGDDGICLKSGTGKTGVDAGPCKDVLVEDNTVIHAHGGFVIGSDASGGVQNVVVRNNRFMGTDTGLRFKTSYGRGGATANIFISNIVMTDIKEQAIVFEAAYANKQVGKADEVAGATDYAPDFKDIHIEHITCRGCKTGILAKGDEGLIHDIDIKNSVIFYIKKATDIQTTCKLDVSNVTFKTFEMEMW